MRLIVSIARDAFVAAALLIGVAALGWLFVPAIVTRRALGVVER